MVAGPFVGPPGAVHVCSDWEIAGVSTGSAVWSAACVTGALAVHIHLGDGTFAGALAGHHQLDPDTPYTLRVRFKDGAPAPADPWSAWSTRAFRTGSASVVEPLVLSDVSRVPDPRWQDVVESRPGPAGRHHAAPRASRRGHAARIPRTRRTGRAGRESAGARRARHRARGLHARAPAPVDLPASRVGFTDGSGTDRRIFLPAIALASGQSVAFWISEAGEAFPADATNADEAPPATFGDALSASPIPWAVKQPGFVIEPVATGLAAARQCRLPPESRSRPGRPLFLRDRALREGPHGHAQRGGVGLCDRPAQLRSGRRLSGLGGEGPHRNRRRPGVGRRLRGGRRSGRGHHGRRTSPASSGSTARTAAARPRAGRPCSISRTSRSGPRTRSPT